MSNKLTAVKLSNDNNVALITSSDNIRSNHPDTYEKAEEGQEYVIHSVDYISIQVPVTIFDPRYGNMPTGQLQSIMLSAKDLRTIVAAMDELIDVSVRKVVKNDLDYLDDLPF